MRLKSAGARRRDGVPYDESVRLRSAVRTLEKGRRALAFGPNDVSTVHRKPAFPHFDRFIDETVGECRREGHRR